MNTVQEISLPIEKQMLMVQMEEKRFELMQRQANMLAKSDFVPDTFKNNIANCALIVEMAHRLKTDAFLVSRQIVVIHGRPSFTSKFVIALLNRSGMLQGRLEFKKTGIKDTDTEGCVAFATELATNKELEGPEVTIAMAKKEGWYSKNGSKWPTMPQIMLQYRAASFFVSMYFPEILAGFATSEEIIDVGTMRDVELEVTRPNRRQPEPRESETVVIDNSHVDVETGEILGEAEPANQPAENENNDDMFSGAGSPGFIALQKKLALAESEQDVRILVKSSLLTKCSRSERTEFQRMAEERSKLISNSVASE